MAIKLLEEQVIAKIAAGEVIERPASVVKELVENSIDAGAKDIHIEANGGGRRLIRVSDNGCGMVAEEIPLAAMRHATSKLRSIEDLESIRTLGFRGEALASIAAVSHMSLMTRNVAEEMGIQVRIEGGIVRDQRPVGAPAGTVITAENLFYNTPARLKFLKADTTERRHVASVVMNYALAYPEVRFTLEQDGRETLHTNGTGHLSDAIVTLFGVDDFKNMVEIEPDEAEQRGGSWIRVSGFTSVPEFNRADRARILLFVNGRAVQDSKVAYAVVQAYHTFLMNGRFPVAVLMLELPPGELDVNVHPAKAEVRFRDPNAVFSAVQRAVRRAVVSQASPLSSVRGVGFATAEDSVSDVITNLGRIQRDVQMDMGLSLDSTGQYARQRDLYRGGSDNRVDDMDLIPEGPDAPSRPRTLPMLRVVGQIAASYVVAEGPSGMYLVDQHAAHERILYEQFMAMYQSQDAMTQHSLDGQTVQLSPLDARLVEENLEVLHRVGFTLESFGPNMFSVRGVPAMLADVNPQALIAAVISDLEMGNKPGEQSIEDRIVKRICKQVAVKAGQVLSLEEMQGLIRQLERCESPHTCPHGRPTILHMSADQLAREFGRAGTR